MSFETIIQVIFYGIALSMDAFAISITEGLIFEDINNKRRIFIASIYGFFQALMPLISYWFIELIAYFAGASQSQEVGNTLSLTVTWVAFALLIFIGTKMVIDGVSKIKKPVKEQEKRLFSIKEVLVMGIATSIDALAVGVSLHSGTLSDNSTIWLHVSIIMLITFIMCVIGLFLGSSIRRLLKSKTDITLIIGGIILLVLACLVVVSYYLS